MEGLTGTEWARIDHELQDSKRYRAWVKTRMAYAAWREDGTQDAFEDWQEARDRYLALAGFRRPARKARVLNIRNELEISPEEARHVA